MNTDALLALVKEDEGWLPFGYDDRTAKPVECSGWLTIGYGFLIDARKGVGLPRPVAEFWLRYAINERLAELQKRWPAFDRMHEDVQLAVASMCYQMGVNGVLQFKDMLAHLERDERAAAASDALQSLWAKQTPARARRVASLIRGV